jgi:hypothetical protein
MSWLKAPLTVRSVGAEIRGKVQPGGVAREARSSEEATDHNDSRGIASYPS